MKMFKRKNKTVLVNFPDGRVKPMKLLAPTVREHNRICDDANAILDKANSTQPGDPNPLTEDEIEFVLSTLFEDSVYRHDEESGWGFW